MLLLVNKTKNDCQKSISIWLLVEAYELTSLRTHLGSCAPKASCQRSPCRFAVVARVRQRLPAHTGNRTDRPDWPIRSADLPASGWDSYSALFPAAAAALPVSVAVFAAMVALPAAAAAAAAGLAIAIAVATAAAVAIVAAAVAAADFGRKLSVLSSSGSGSTSRTAFPKLPSRGT